MKLPVKKLTLSEALNEFDVWITPTLGNITDTDKFKKELAKLTEIFDILGEATNNFSEETNCLPETIAKQLIELAQSKKEKDKKLLFEALASILFLVTGKSDNNAKCQLPIYLRDEANWSSFPSIKKIKGKNSISNGPIPRELKAKKYMEIVAALDDMVQQERLLEKFVSFLLRDEKSISQLWSIGYSYINLKAFGREKDLITPLVIFQVRGSVTASGGHEPEERLRLMLNEWGLLAGRDYNMTDVIINGEINNKAKKKKTRAFDFILPFDTPGWAAKWQKRLFIQCQFYAGDAGSVSHKNVDQVRGSRDQVKKKISDTRFLEYVDGAGYFSSLNGDLNNLLRMEDTLSFFQLRSVPIRLRRELQQIGFLLPIELESAVLRTDGSINDTRNLLVKEGYAIEEVERCIKDCVERGIIQRNDIFLIIKDERRDLVRRYFILDIVANYGQGQAGGDNSKGGVILVPGYGAFYGMSLTSIVEKCIEVAPQLSKDWSNPKVILADIEHLYHRKIALSR